MLKWNTISKPKMKKISKYFRNMDIGQWFYWSNCLALKVSDNDVLVNYGSEGIKLKTITNEQYFLAGVTISHEEQYNEVSE